MIGKSLEDGWTALRENGWRLLGVSLLMGILIFLVSAVGLAVVGAIWYSVDPEALSDLVSQLQSPGDEPPEIPQSVDIVAQLLINVLSSLFLGGFYAAFLAAVRGEPFGVGILFSRMGDFWKYFVAYLVVSFVVGFGFLFLILPGIYLGVRLSLYPFAIADGYGPFDAPFTVSWEATQKRFWTVFGFYAALIGIGLLVFGAIGMVFFLGVLFPFFMSVGILLLVLGGIGFSLYAVTASAALYNQLLEEKGISPARADSSLADRYW
ncbi:hypothetical protein [Brockia lithotrophica]|uniref:Glycerophosphoryl diester phosphodiesterase membrane domain-containing protein n=1 Tax=Brockia lithotrophica TaxID=933949 RepID=A0A660L5T4_9BACL|nr:hypothetical protein [Brockia lithotrophica]RKQ88788.1 hypothetical protein C7438_0430 [Brockia lithotrophica]